MPSNGRNGHAIADFPFEQKVTFEKGNIAIDVTLVFDREDDSITALCSELGTASFGDTVVEAQEAIVDALILQFQTLEDHGDLIPALLENGVVIRLQPPTWSLARETIPA